MARKPDFTMKKNTLTLRVNDTWSFSGDDLEHIDILPTGPGQFHILYHHTSYQARVVSADMRTKTLRIKVEGETHEIRLLDSFDALVEKLGLAVDPAQQVSNVMAPMPGLVLEVLAEPGQTVDANQPLLILEAMKMENVIKSPGEGTIKTIHIREGEAVEKNQLMVEFE